MSRPAASLGLMRMIEAVPDRLDGSPRQLRRFWSDEFKATAVERACQPGVNMSAIARQIGILPSQLYRWRRELLGNDEPGQTAGTEDPQSVASGPDPVVEIIIGNMVVRAGRHVDEAHLQRVIRAVRSA
jgi:transposase